MATYRSSFEDPLHVANRGMRFEHGARELALARDFIGPMESDGALSSAKTIIFRIHQNMRVLPTAFGVGAPRTLEQIVEKRGGNCVSYAILAVAMLRSPAYPPGWSSRTSTRTSRSCELRRVSCGRRSVRRSMVMSGWKPKSAGVGSPLTPNSEWLAARLLRGVTIGALGLPVTERWEFPLRLRRLDATGQPDEDVTELYLVEKLRGLLGLESPLSADWLEGVRYFAEAFDWSGRAGGRILLQYRRLRRMSSARARLAEVAASPARSPGP